MGAVPRVLMGLMFFPRGGSAQVARYLARSLPDAGWDVTVACGSLGGPGEQSNAETFFDGLDVRALDYTPPPRRPTRWRPTRPSSPPTRIAPGRRTGCSRAWTTRTSSAWSRSGRGQLERAGAARADLLHLHHLTPINEAAERRFPDVPRIGHLHGTELLMLREIDEGPPQGWDHAGAWAERMRRWARGCERLLVLSPDAVRRVPGPARRGSRADGVGPERLRPARVRPPAGRTREAAGALAPLARGGAARLGRVGRAGQRGLQRGASWSRSAPAARCCSTWGATPRSSASRC